MKWPKLPTISSAQNRMLLSVLVLNTIFFHSPWQYIIMAWSRWRS